MAVKSKKNEHWCFPKGHMEKDESMKQTALREVFEETGLMVTLISDFKLREYEDITCLLTFDNSEQILLDVKNFLENMR